MCVGPPRAWRTVCRCSRTCPRFCRTALDLRPSVRRSGRRPRGRFRSRSSNMLKRYDQRSRMARAERRRHHDLAALAGPAGSMRPPTDAARQIGGSLNRRRAISVARLTRLRGDAGALAGHPRSTRSGILASADAASAGRDRVNASNEPRSRRPCFVESGASWRRRRRSLSTERGRTRLRMTAPSIASVASRVRQHRLSSRHAMSSHRSARSTSQGCGMPAVASCLRAAIL